MGKLWIIACKSLICPDWLTLLSSNFQVSKIKTSSSKTFQFDQSNNQATMWMDQPPLTLCVSSSSLFVLLPNGPSSWYLINRVKQFLIQWLVGGIHGGWGWSESGNMFAVNQCQLTKYDNFIILNPVSLQKESLCKTMVKISLKYLK